MTAHHASKMNENLIHLNVQSFGSLFPYRIFDEKRSVFINTKSVMKIAEIPLLSGANEKLIKDLVSCFNKNIADDVYVRIFRLTHRKIQSRLDAIKNNIVHRTDVFDAISNRQMDFMKYAAINGFVNKSSLETTILDSRLFFEVSIESNFSNQDEKTR